MLIDKVNDLLARQVSLEHQNPAVIDDRQIEAHPLSADINAGPHSHASKHAPLQYRHALWRVRRSDSSRGCTGRGHHSAAKRNGSEAPAPAGVSSERGPARLQMARSAAIGRGNYVG
jgi:hypothetical protein